MPNRRVMAANNTAVAKGKLVDGATPKIENVQVIYRQRPTLKSNLHFGSRLVFAKDGTLFVTQGERSIMPGRMQAQDLKSGIGKIVRINKDGTIPKDNPFVGDKNGALPEIWSYGHGNSQGAFLHPATGELWSLSTVRRAATKSTSRARARTMAGPPSPTASSMAARTPRSARARSRQGWSSRSITGIR